MDVAALTTIRANADDFRVEYDRDDGEHRMRRAPLLATAAALLLGLGTAGSAAAAQIAAWDFDSGADGWALVSSTCPAITTAGFDPAVGLPRAGSLFEQISPTIGLLLDCRVTLRSPRVRGIGPGTLGVTTWALPSFGPLAQAQLECEMGYYDTPYSTARVIGFDTARNVEDVSFIGFEMPTAPDDDGDGDVFYDFDVTLHVRSLVTALVSYRLGIDTFHVQHTP